MRWLPTPFFYHCICISSPTDSSAANAGHDLRIDLMVVVIILELFSAFNELVHRLEIGVLA